ncbi:MAG: hypothetical protein ACLTZT_06650 [Butyricimonas faecalis]
MKININISTGSVVDKILRAIKYILLFWIFYMTISSSELFCKTLTHTTLLQPGSKAAYRVDGIDFYRLPILGNLFINMFWCKYICPLGALSNVFKFTLTFLVLLILVNPRPFRATDAMYCYSVQAVSVTFSSFTTKQSIPITPHYPMTKNVPTAV